MTAVDVLGRVDELANRTGGSVDTATGAAIGPYRKSRVRLPQMAWRLVRSRLGATLLILVSGSAAVAQAPAVPPPVTFPGGQHPLLGHLVKPAGDGPFPAMIWNHGSEAQPRWQPELAHFYLEHGWALFLPHRRGQGLSPGEYIMDRLRTTRRSEWGRRLVELHEAQLADVAAAVDYLKTLPDIDHERIAMSGCSFGGIQTLLAAEQGLGLLAAVAFAPGAQTWNQWMELQERLKKAGRRAAVDLEMTQSARPHRVKVFPPYGTTTQDGHWRFCTRATDVWGPDVLSFLTGATR